MRRTSWPRGAIVIAACQLAGMHSVASALESPPDPLISARADHMVLDAASGRSLQSLNGHPDSVFDVVWIDEETSVPSEGTEAED